MIHKVQRVARTTLLVFLSVARFLLSFKFIDRVARNFFFFSKNYAFVKNRFFDNLSNNL